ncbi:MAG: hypothetical protein JNK78_09325 [Planctomycetes bacterium]|nr:hypothetical protein [Planctomycetota bacterium]
MSTLDTAGRGIAVSEGSPRTAAEWLWPLLPIGVSVFSISALVYYHLNYAVVHPTAPLQVLIAGLYRALGLAPAVIFFLLVVTWSTIWFVVGSIERPLVRLGRIALLAVMLGVLLNLGDGGVTPAPNKGQLGAWLAGALVSAVGYLPSIVLVWAMTFAALLLATDFFFSDSFERLRRAGPIPEGGVETAVTDHLRGLGALMPTPRTEAVPEPFAPVQDSNAPLFDGTGDVGAAPSNGDEEPAAHRDEPEPWWEPAASMAGEPLADEAVAAERDVAMRSLEESVHGVPVEPADVDEALEPADAATARATPSLELDFASAIDEAEPAATAEPIVDIPRPEPHVPVRGAQESALPPTNESPAVRQQGLFDGGVDEGLIAEAMDLLEGTRRVSASLLQRRLRIDYAQAIDLLTQLAARGVVELEGDATQGRVLA